MLDQLPEIQSGQAATPLQGHLNLEKVGIFGMSFGGASAVQACLNEPRCKAVDLSAINARFLEVDGKIK